MALLRFDGKLLKLATHVNLNDGRSASMQEKLDEQIRGLKTGEDLSADSMRAAMATLLNGTASESSMREFLILLAEKGETVDELAGAAQALRQSMHRISVQRRPIVDTCGTGGDGSKTFNISTAAAIAIAAAGVAVAKHGNRKITSSTGSADVLSELGINLAATPEVAARCLNDLGLCFCFAPSFHSAMKNVSEVRRSISTPTIFNRLGPLANPASADCQVLGVGAEGLVEVMAGALQKLGTTRSLVVRGEDGVDEISLSAATRVIEVTSDSIREHRWQPADFGLQPADRGELFADSPQSSAECIRAVLAGEHGPRRDVVVINAAAGLWIAGVEGDLAGCARRVEMAIDSGAAAKLVEALGQATHEIAN